MISSKFAEVISFQMFVHSFCSESASIVQLPQPQVSMAILAWQRTVEEGHTQAGQYGNPCLTEDSAGRSYTSRSVWQSLLDRGQCRKVIHKQVSMAILAWQRTVQEGHTQVYRIMVATLIPESGTWGRASFQHTIIVIRWCWEEIHINVNTVNLRVRR